jgi:enoyl-CoA hydratase/carnithine racemase
VTSSRHGHDVGIDYAGPHVAVVELRRGPDNFFDTDLIGHLADAFERLDRDDRCRAVVLASEGKHFCAGARFTPDAPPPNGGGPRRDAESRRHVYDEALRLFATTKPVVAAIQGAAVGGGLGLALACDFRVAGPRARFAASFSRLGFHHGFGLTVTLPRLVGHQAALDLLYSGRAVRADEAHALGLCDEIATGEDELRAAAVARAERIAASAPLAVQSIRSTMSGSALGAIRDALAHERQEQERLQQTADWREGVEASIERRTPRFSGR